MEIGKKGERDGESETRSVFHAHKTKTFMVVIRVGCYVLRIQTYDKNLSDN